MLVEKKDCEKKCKLLKAVRDHCYLKCLYLPAGLDRCYQEDCPLYPYLEKAGE